MRWHMRAWKSREQLSGAWWRARVFGQILILALLLMIPVTAGRALAAAELPPGGTFMDDDGDIHEADIEAISAIEVTKGCNPPENDRFCPDEFVTRGQMAAFLVRALGYTDDGGGDLFVDDDGSTFESDIDKLGTTGVTKGCNPPENDRFCPDEFVTRGQMAAFLVRALGYTEDGGGDLFVDDDGSTFESDIDKLGAAGITKGCNPPANDEFCPNDFVTRGQMAAFLTRALELTSLTPPARKVVFTADTGINAGFDPWDDSDQPGAYYERWRLWDRSLGCDPDTDLRPCTIDITEDNAEVWVKFPNGTEQEVASQLFYYPIRFIPTSPAGVYEFTFELNSGVTHRAMIDFRESQLVTVRRTGQTRTQGRTRFIAFSLEGVDLRDSDNAFHHRAGGPITWFPPEEKDFWIAESELQPGDHTFLAKVEGRWYYAKADSP